MKRPRLKDYEREVHDGDHLADWYREYYKALEKYADFLETKAGKHETFVMWRSVENEMPDDFIGVLVADKRGRIYLAEWDGGNFIQTAEGEYAYDITHWAPLPEPPQAT